MLFGWKRPPKFRGPTFSKAIFGSSEHFPASLSIVRRKTEPLIFYIQLFNAQYNLTKFVFLIHKWIIANSIWLIFELYTNLRTSPRKKFDVNIATLIIVVYKTVLLCIRHDRLLICCQMRRQSSYHLSGYWIVQTYVRLIAVFARWYKTESTKRRVIMLMSWSNELCGCAMRWNRLSIGGAKDFKYVFDLAAAI